MIFHPYYSKCHGDVTASAEQHLDLGILSRDHRSGDQQISGGDHGGGDHGGGAYAPEKIRGAIYFSFAFLYSF